jgi:hypothetical protein
MTYTKMYEGLVGSGVEHKSRDAAKKMVDAGVGCI